MQCTGRYCDNVYLFCDTLGTGITLDPNFRWFSDWFSEELDNGQHTCILNGPGGRSGVMTGVQCAGSY